MAGCRTSAENIKIEPVYATWEQQNMVKVKTIADVSESLDGKYFKISTPTTKYYVWMDIDDAADPAPVGYTGIPVTLTANSSAAAIATAIAAAINGNAQMQAAVDGCDPSSVYIQCKKSGDVLEVAADATAGAATGFTISTPRKGAVLELGALDGDIEVGLTEDILDVDSHQTGTQILAGLRTGRNIQNLALTMKESDAAKLQAVIEASGVKFTPAGVGSTPVSGWGSEDNKAFANILPDCRKLVLHPISQPDNVLTSDLCFWRAYPMLQGLTLSGTSPRMINVEFKILPDQLLDKNVRQFVFGDHSQNFMSAGV